MLFYQYDSISSEWLCSALITNIKGPSLATVHEVKLLKDVYLRRWQMAKYQSKIIKNRLEEFTVPRWCTKYIWIMLLTMIRILKCVGLWRILLLNKNWIIASPNNIKKSTKTILVRQGLNAGRTHPVTMLWFPSGLSRHYFDSVAITLDIRFHCLLVFSQCKHFLWNVIVLLTILWLSKIMFRCYYLGLDDLYLVFSNNMAWWVTNMSFVCHYFPFSANIN